MKKLLANCLFARMALVILAGLTAAVAVSNIGARAASISLLTGPNDPSQGQITVNQLIQSINSGVTGVKNSQYVTSGNGADSTEDTLFTYSIPASTLATNGQAMRITCFGNSTNNTDTKTVKLYFGATSYSVSITASTANSWRAEMLVVRAGATAAQVYASAVQGATPIANTFTANSDTLTSAVVTKCTGTAGTGNANDIMGQGFLVEILQ